MTKDNVLVLFHDEDLSSKTNLNGLVNSHIWEELKAARYTEKPYLDYSIISLEQLFSNLKNIEKNTFALDCKLYTKNNVNIFYSSYMEALIEIIQKYNLEHNVTIESTSSEFLRLCKEIGLDYKLFISPAVFEKGLDIAIDLDLYGITLSTEKITKKQIDIAHDNNLRIALYGIRTRSEHIDAINMNPDYLQSDNVPLMNKLLD